MEINDVDLSLKVFNHFTSGTKHHLTNDVSDIAPDVKQYIMDFVFGKIYARSGLEDQEKAIVTIVTLMSIGGCEHELNTHINTALNVGVSPKKIVDVFIQALPYAGFPRVINAISVAKVVFKEKNVNI